MSCSATPEILSLPVQFTVSSRQIHSRYEALSHPWVEGAANGIEKHRVYPFEKGPKLTLEHPSNSYKTI